MHWSELSLKLGYILKQSPRSLQSFKTLVCSNGVLVSTQVKWVLMRVPFNIHRNNSFYDEINVLHSPYYTHSSPLYSSQMLACCLFDPLIWTLPIIICRIQQFSKTLVSSQFPSLDIVIFLVINKITRRSRIQGKFRSWFIIGFMAVIYILPCIDACMPQGHRISFLGS